MVWKSRSTFISHRILPLAGTGFASVFLSGCFLFVQPDRSQLRIAESRPGDAALYRLHDDDSYSCFRIFLPEKPAYKPYPAVVIFPGGAYGVLAWEKEGLAYAEFLNRQGIAGIVVKYPLGSLFGHFARHPAMVDAAQRVIRLIRFNAEKLQIDPNRIGVMGSSAGGHLAGLCAVWDNAGKSDSDDPVERVSARPDFAILCYPVVSMSAPCTHQLSRKNLTGSDAPKELLDKLSLEKQVTKAFPPVFLWLTLEDRTVDPENSRLLEAALKKNGVFYRVFYYPHGPHGMGLLNDSERKKYPDAARWSVEMIGFLQDAGIIPKGNRP